MVVLFYSLSATARALPNLRGRLLDSLVVLAVGLISLVNGGDATWRTGAREPHLPAPHVSRSAPAARAESLCEPGSAY